jgi:hypothetical protein
MRIISAFAPVVPLFKPRNAHPETHAETHDPCRNPEIGVLPFLIRRLKRSHPDLFQPWYADDAGAGGKFADIRAMFEISRKWDQRMVIFRSHPRAF